MKRKIVAKAKPKIEPEFPNEFNFTCTCGNVVPLRCVGGQYEYTWTSAPCKMCGIDWNISCEAAGQDYENEEGVYKERD